MVDIQKENDLRGVSLNKVGVKGIKYPVKITNENGLLQHTVADINLYVDLDSKKRGIHMSRLVEELHNWDSQVDFDSVKTLLTEIRDKMESEQAHAEIDFLFFLRKQAPISKKQGLMNYKCSIRASVNKENKYEWKVNVCVPITSVCPCSKAISDNGAHNQRGEVNITVQSSKIICVEQLINVAENAASCAVYSVLKRPDEKYVTESAFENSKFVEDILRDVVISLKENSDIEWFDASVENHESIHNHNAFAKVI